MTKYTIYVKDYSERNPTWKKAKTITGKIKAKTELKILREFARDFYNNTGIIIKYKMEVKLK